MDVPSESIRQPGIVDDEAVDGIVITEHASTLVNMASATEIQQMESAISYCNYLSAKDVDQEIASSQGRNVQARSILVGRHSGMLLQLKKKEMTWSSPALFPNGRGGPDEHRKHSYSLHALVDHYLSLLEDGFKNDSAFVLFAYDKVSTAAALKSISLTCSNNPQLAESAASLRPVDL